MTTEAVVPREKKRVHKQIIDNKKPYEALIRC
jgi:hypothetical protein